MSWLSKGLKKLDRAVSKPLKAVGLTHDSKLVHGIGKGLDLAGDFLPPGFRDVANFSGKRMQGSSTKQAALGAALDYGGGKVLKAIGSKVPGLNKLPGMGAKTPGLPDVDLSAVDGIGGIVRGADGSVLRGVTGALSAAKPNLTESLTHSITGGNGLSGALKNVGKFALDNPDLVLGGIAGYQGYQASKAADKARAVALNDPGLNPVRPDLSSTFAGYVSPYTKPAAIPAAPLPPAMKAVGRTSRKRSA